MSTDPLQLLIDAGAIPSSPFEASSRYQGVPLAVHQPRPELPARVHLTRRLVPLPMAPTAEAAGASDGSGLVGTPAHWTVRAGERPDTVAAQVLGDPLLYWRLADANAVLDPASLTDTPGRRIRLPGSSGA